MLTQTQTHIVVAKKQEGERRPAVTEALLKCKWAQTGPLRDASAHPTNTNHLRPIYILEKPHESSHHPSHRTQQSPTVRPGAGRRERHETGPRRSLATRSEGNTRRHALQHRVVTAPRGHKAARSRRGQNTQARRGGFFPSQT